MYVKIIEPIVESVQRLTCMSTHLAALEVMTAKTAYFSSASEHCCTGCGDEEKEDSVQNMCCECLVVDTSN